MQKIPRAFRKNGDEIVVEACHGNADTILLEHTIISDRKKNQDRDREQRDKVTEHPVQALVRRHRAWRYLTNG